MAIIITSRVGVVLLARWAIMSVVNSCSVNVVLVGSALLQISLKKDTKMKVLLVEDDLALAQALCRYLKHEVVHVGTYADALRSMDGVDVVVSDWDLGMTERMTGDQIVLGLREEFPDVRYLIYSGMNRKCPDGVDFILKDDPNKIRTALDNISNSLLD